MARRTQKDTVLMMLRAAGDHGVSVHDLVYREGITRGAAIVHGLRKDERLAIETVDEGAGKLARYILHESPKPPIPRCACGHTITSHVGLRHNCLAYVKPANEPWNSKPCDCKAFRAA